MRGHRGGGRGPWRRNAGDHGPPNFQSLSGMDFGPLITILGAVINGLMSLVAGVFGGTTSPSAHTETAASRELTDRQLRARVRRIGRNCNRLRSEARKAGGVFENLGWQAPELADRASELAGLLLKLRRTVRNVQRGKLPRPSPPGGVSRDDADRVLREELDAGEAAQERLDALIQHNLRSQQICLTQLERIDDLVAAALLEVAAPIEITAAGTPQRSIVNEVEDELAAAQQALAQVSQHQA